MRWIPLLRRRAPASERRGSLARRLFLVLIAMLLALVAVAGARLVTFRTTVSALEEFRAETVGESKRIAEVRVLLEKADDAGEAYVETNDSAAGKLFVAISRQIDRGFVDLELAGSRSERLLASSARLRWEQARASVEKAILLPAGGDGERLDLFHDGVDEAAGLLSDQFALNVAEVGQEILGAPGPRAHPVDGVTRDPAPGMRPGRSVVPAGVSLDHLAAQVFGGGGVPARPR